MNLASWLLSGFFATLALATIMSLSQGLGFTRMNLPYLLGTIFSPRRETAKIYGLLIQIAIGWGFSLLYVLGFEALKSASWWLGVLFGIAHAMFLLSVGMSVLPGMHPRMASEQHGPNAARLLEPPGFMALNYGYQTPLWVFVAHIVFGAMMGLFYQLR